MEFDTEQLTPAGQGNLQQIKTVQTETNPLRTLLFNQKGYVLTAAKLTQFLVSK